MFLEAHNTVLGVHIKESIENQFHQFCLFASVSTGDWHGLITECWSVFYYLFLTISNSRL